MIPVLLMLVYPGPAYAGPVQAAAPRASDADRDIAADILCAAVGDGRLTLGELDDRLGAALSARTTIELAALIADLPGRRCAPPATRLSEPAGRLGSGSPAPSRWSVIQALANARTALTSATARRCGLRTACPQQPSRLNLSHSVEGARLLGTLPPGVWGAGAPHARGAQGGSSPRKKHCAVDHGGALGSMQARQGAITSAA